MLSQQESAWVVYSAIFLFFTIFLSLRCRKNMLLIPFVIFGMLISIGSICLLAAHSGLSTTINTAIASAASNNINFSLNRYWQGKSLTLSLLPAASFLLFLGIMEAEIIFIRHLAVALNNRERWSSIYLRDPEKSSGFAQPKAKKSSLRPWTYWVSFILLAIYLVVAMVSVIVETTMEDTSKDLGVAICVSMLWFISGLNVFVIWCSCNSSANHVRTIRRNRDDLKFLRFTPILFFVLITGCTGSLLDLLCHTYCFHDALDSSRDIQCLCSITVYYVDVYLYR